MQTKSEPHAFLTDAPLLVELERRGVFEVNVSGSDQGQCGRRGTRRLRYGVKIMGDDQHLNAQGFIIDNQEIHDYFVNKYRDVVDLESCEVIASTACRDLCAMFGKGHLEGVRVCRIEVVVGAAPEFGDAPLVGIKAMWDRQPDPRFTAWDN